MVPSGRKVDVVGRGPHINMDTLHVVLLENVEHCGDEPEQAANMHMNRLSFTLK